MIEADPTDGALDSAVEVERLHGPLFWSALCLGWGVMVFGFHGLLVHRGQANPTQVLRIAIELNIFNDALAAPATIAGAFLLRRLLPRWALAPAQVGLILSVITGLYAYPLVGDYGRNSRSGPSRLPWNYAHNLLLVLGAVWLACGVAALWSRRRQQRA